jgi:hypothetical protein
MTACSGGQPEPQLSEAAPDDTAQSFYTQLAALQSQYGFTAMDKVELTAGADFASTEDGSVQLLEDLALNDRGGLLLEFSFTQSLDSADNALYFVIQSAGTRQAFISRDGLQVLQDGQPLASYAFNETPDWQPGTPYAMFLYRTAAGGLEVSVWDSAQPAWIALLKAEDDILGSDAAQVGLKLAGEQTLTIHDLWSLIYTPGVAEGQAAQDQDALSSEPVGYQMTSMGTIDSLMCNGRSAGEEGVFTWGDIYNDELCQLSIQMGQALTFDFTLSEPVDQWEDIAYVVLEANRADNQMPTKSLGVPLANDRLMLEEDGDEFDKNEYGEIIYTPDLEISAGVLYSASIAMNPDHEFEIAIWPADDPESRITAEIHPEDVPSTWLPVEGEQWQFGIWIVENQQVTISNLVRYTLTAKGSTGQTVFQAEELEGYQITETKVVDVLDCDGHAPGEAGAFSWDANANEHCDLSLQTGQALAFDFTLSKSADEWAHMAYMMLDANIDDIQMPTKSLGIPLANDKVVVKQDGEESPSIPYSNGFELTAGVPYSVLVVLNAFSEFEISIWPESDPDLRLSAVINGNNAPSTWLPVEGEQWRFGMWIAEDQQVSITNLVRYTLIAEGSTGQAGEAAVENNESAADQPEWAATGMIPNLGEFFIENIHPYGEIDCGGDALSANGRLDFPVNTGDITYECQIDLQEESGFIMEFVYSTAEPATQDAHLYDFAFVTGEGESQRLIRFDPNGNTLYIKKGSEVIGEFPDRNQVTFEPGISYTMVFIPAANKYIYIWPSENPDQRISEDINNDEWKDFFGEGADPGAWQLRTWIAAGVELQIRNIYQFEAH